jgi:hypothetical protein
MSCLVLDLIYGMHTFAMIDTIIGRHKVDSRPAEPFSLPASS